MAKQPKSAKEKVEGPTAEEQLAALKKENASLKKAVGEQPKVDMKTVKMIWTHKKLSPGTKENVFGMEGEVNKEGFLLVDCPKYKVKNEMSRRPKFLVPLDYYLKRKEAEAALEEEFSE